MVISSQKYEVKEISKSAFEVKMTLTIRNLQRDDSGSYRCIAKNSLGEVESSIRVYGKYRTHHPHPTGSKRFDLEIPGPTRGYAIAIDEEDYNEQQGSAERDDDMSNSVLERGRGSHTTTRTSDRDNSVAVDAGVTRYSFSALKLLTVLIILFRI